MKRQLISLVLVAGVFLAIVGVARPKPAEASVEVLIDALIEACLEDPAGCVEFAQDVHDLYNFAADAATGSYLEECVGEGCSFEEVRELASMYQEETLFERGGTYEEVKELAFNDGDRALLSPEEQNAFVLVMLTDFMNHGWSVRKYDLDRAKGL
jgi:hypothetical protein